MEQQDFLNLIKSKNKVIIELGCGPNKSNPLNIGIDALPLKGVDIITNLEKGLDFIPDNTIDELISFHFLEHIENLDFLIQEINRVLKPDGLHKVVVPHFSNPHYYSDITHKKFFGLYTFDYFATDASKLKRTVPNYNTPFKFHILQRRIIFKSQFFIRNLIKKWIFTKFFNINKYFQEYYEECCTGIIPASEILFVMKPEK